MRHYQDRFAGDGIAGAFRAATAARRRRPSSLARALMTDMRVDRKSFRSWPARAEDADRLAALERWAALYASDGSSPEQVAAARTSARTAREISSIRSHRAAIMASIDPADPDPETRRVLAVLARRQRLWQVSQQSANQYLVEAADDG